MTASTFLGVTVYLSLIVYIRSLALEVLDEKPINPNIGSGFNIADINSTIRQTVIETIDETIRKNAALSALVENSKVNKQIVQDARKSDKKNNNIIPAVDIGVNNNRRLLRVGGKKDDSSMLRIMGGTDTTINAFPYVVSIVVRDEHWCNGAIITPYYVITAAHCTNFVLPVSHDPVILGQRLKVRSGSSSTSEGKLTPVKAVVRHPFFELQPPPHFDVALLELAEDLLITTNETTGSTAKIQISDELLAPFPQSFVTVCGWGATKPSSGDRSSTMQSARLKTRTQEYCVGSYQDVNGLYINENFVCASLLRNLTSKRDLCIFDGGAPAVQGNKLVAVLSFGPENCGEGPPLVFVRLPPLLPWITKQVEELEKSRSAKSFIG